jgi:hypothetical protein
MEVLQFLKRCFIQKNISLVESLPNEIIQHIATFLPLCSTAAFALCSHRIYIVLGTSYWEGLKRTPRQRELANDIKARVTRDSQPQGEREELLSLLERDLPNLIFCCFCSILHPVNNSYNNRRVCSRSIWSMNTRHGKEFSMVQMTMKRYRLGLSYWRQLSWFSSVTNYGWDCEVKDTSYKIVEARIANGRLLLRSQFWIVFPTGATEPSNRAMSRAYVCPHIPERGLFNSRQLLQKMVTCRMSHWRDRDYECLACSGLKQCHYCHTEFRIDARELGNDGFIIATTIWWDLGSGVSPYDLEYKRHCTMETYRFFNNVPQVKFEAGSIQGAFGDHEFSVDSSLKWKRWLFKLYARRSAAMA